MRSTTGFRSWSGRFRPGVADASAALTLAAVTLAYLPSMEPGPGLAPAAVALTLAQTVPLVWRRRAPFLVWLVVVVAGGVWIALDYPDVAALLFGVPVAIANVALHGSHRASYGAAVLTAVGTIGAALALGMSLLSFDVVLGLAMFALAWFVGDNVRRRRLHAAVLEERAERLERAREEHARRLVLEERARIARELHDVVAHHVGMIAVQAETGPYLAAAGPERAADGFAAIGTTARQAMTEMRRLLGVLRDESEAGSREPQPGLADLDGLLAEHRRAGLAVASTIRGEARTLAPGVDLSAYRIVQEALTNVRRHAGPARAVVDVAYEERALRLRVIDDGCGPNGRDRERSRGENGDGGGAGNGDGHGLVGMRERATMLGGRLETGPAPGGGFLVEAVLPLEPPPQPPGSG